MTGRARTPRTFCRITGEEIEAHRLVRSLDEDERRVLAGIVQGKSLQAVAGEMGISEGVVEDAHSEILRKFAVRTTADLVRIGLYAGHGAGT